jgi:hypothetical protein
LMDEKLMPGITAGQNYDIFIFTHTCRGKLFIDILKL